MCLFLCISGVVSNHAIIDAVAVQLAWLFMSSTLVTPTSTSGSSSYASSPGDQQNC
jgi:hypothetical protein